MALSVPPPPPHCAALFARGDGVDRGDDGVGGCFVSVAALLRGGG